jgi:CheY-specific phosphatase CheX
MKTKIKEALKEASVSTFEDVCFMYTEPELKEAQKKLKWEAAAEVKYRGNFKGKLIIETYGNLLSVMAANILGNEPVSSRQKNDALGEIANIICGNVVPYLGSRQHGCKIESPRALKKEDLTKEERGNPLASVSLNFQNGRTEIKFFVDGNSTAGEKKK